MIDDFCEQLAQSYEETYTLFRALRLLSSGEDPPSTVQQLCADVQRTLPFAWLALAFGTGPRIVSSLRGRLILAGDAPAPIERLGPELTRRADALAADSWTKVLQVGRDPLATLVDSQPPDPLRQPPSGRLYREDVPNAADQKFRHTK